MRTETIEIDDRFGAEYKGKYVFQEITWAKRSRIIQKHTKYHLITGQVVSSDLVAIQAETIWASLRGRKPPESLLTLEKLLDEENGVPVELGELFAKVSNRLNGMSQENVRFLLEQLDEESRTQLLQSLDYVKNSAGPQTSSQSSQHAQSTSSL